MSYNNPMQSTVDVANLVAKKIRQVLPPSPATGKVLTKHVNAPVSCRGGSDAQSACMRLQLESADFRNCQKRMLPGQQAAATTTMQQQQALAVPPPLLLLLLTPAVMHCPGCNHRGAV